MSVPTITARELQQKIHSGSPILLIDVRTPVEFRQTHIPLSLNIPLDTLSPEKLPSPDTPVCLICRSGKRSSKACQQLLDTGTSTVATLDGGIDAWESAGLPLATDRNIISLERQVRITAGTLTLIGALLAFFIHPYWLALPAFVGAGLAFAGITNTCGMALLLAKMPWNRPKH